MKYGWALVVVVLLCGACSGGGSAKDPTATPSPEGAAEASATPAAAQPTPTPYFTRARELKTGPPVSLPPGVVVYARDALWEGSGGSLRRWYRDSSGELVIDELLASRDGADPYALTTVFPAAQGEMWATMCHGFCYGELEPVTVVRSDDGGVTWHDVHTFERGGWGTLFAVDGEDLIIREFENGWRLARLTPDGRLTPIVLPASIPASAEIFAEYTSSGPLLVAASGEQRTVWDLVTGAVLASIPVPNPFQQIRVQGFERGSGGQRLTVVWYGPGSSVDWDWYYGSLDLRTGEFARVLRGNRNQGAYDLYNLSWISDTRAIGRASLDAARYLPGHPTRFGGVPAVIDFEAATVSPIESFVETIAHKAGGPVPVLVVSGEFARVKAGSDCLNVRQLPSLSAAVLGCYADGVILMRGGAEPSGDWRPVHTPDGREGWAAGEFLEAFP